MSEKFGYTAKQVNKRQEEIDAVRKAYQFDSFTNLCLPPAGLDKCPRQDLVQGAKKVVEGGRPNIDRVGGAETNIVVDMPVQTDLPGLSYPGNAVVGVAARNIGVQALDQRDILEDRNTNFAREFPHILRRRGGRQGIVVPQGLRDRGLIDGAGSGGVAAKP